MLSCCLDINFSKYFEKLLWVRKHNKCLSFNKRVVYFVSECGTLLSNLQNVLRNTSQYFCRIPFSVIFRTTRRQCFCMNFVTSFTEHLSACFHNTFSIFQNISLVLHNTSQYLFLWDHFSVFLHKSSQYF